MLALVILVGCFLIRAVPRMVLKNAFTSDTYYHLHCADIIRRNSFKIPAKLPSVVLGHEHTYPFGYHLLLAAFPKTYRLWAERLSGAAFDTTNAAIGYFFSSWLVQEYASPTLQGLPLIMTGLYAVSPAMLRTGPGPSVYNGSPRILGQTLYLLHITSACYAFSTGNHLVLGISLLAGAALIISAKFANQVLLVFGAFLGIFVSWNYLLLIPGSFVVAAVLTRGRAVDIVLGQIRHSGFYVKYLQEVFLWPTISTLRLYLRSLAGHLREMISSGGLRQFLIWHYTERYFLHQLFTVHPQFLFAIPFVMGSYPPHGQERFLLAWAAAGLFSFFATNTKRLAFLGERERYLEYAFIPSMYIALRFLLEHDALRAISAFAAYSVISTACNMAIFFGIYNKFEQSYLPSESIFEKLNSLPPGVIWPIGTFHWQTAYRSGFPVLSHGCNIDEKLLSHDEFMLVYGNYPFASAHFSEILEKYHVAYVLSDARSINEYAHRISGDPVRFFGMLELLFETSTLAVYRVRR